MVIAANLGFPRIGLNRELKKAQEAYWKGKISEAELQNTASELRERHWKLQQDAGIEHIPSNDFSFYDTTLDTIAMVGAVPSRYNWDGNEVNLDTFFAMARGRQDTSSGVDVVAMEMTKWFDTNYHYIVPEFDNNTKFKLSSTKIINEYLEAKQLGIETRPVLLGPVSFLLLGKSYDETQPLDLLDSLLPIYIQMINELDKAGAQWLQIDEPYLVMDLDEKQKNAYKAAYEQLERETNINIMLTTYFGALEDNLSLAANLPSSGLHIDLVRGNGKEQLNDVLSAINGQDKILSLGLINGRNIWKTDLSQAYEQAKQAVDALGADKLMIAPSCSLLHSPVDLDTETKLDDEFKSWLAFSKQKLQEVALLANAIRDGKEKYQQAFDDNQKAIISRQKSGRIHDESVQERVAALNDSHAKRDSVFDNRIKKQESELNLPLLPTTTIGSFPQTTEIRQIRAKFKKGEITAEQYEQEMEQKTAELVAWQDEIGIDVPVHGEYERNDMVEYFGEQLQGYAFTKNGWVQSYGSRCVKPPIIYGDVHRPEAMTVRWSSYAQSLTNNPVKGMLTGPVTMLQWAFVRDDQPVDVTCRQISLAIRDEVADLEKSGIRIIQIDEPAFREGLPLRQKERDFYLNWAVECFRISSSGIDDGTQIHTHMCYSEFNDIIDSIADMDADVISIETSRSAMELLDAFVEFKYPNEIGPGVYDIHSPRIPKTEEMEKLLQKALQVLEPQQVWVNPDCGLKTRGWDEVRPALENMVEAAKNIRAKIADSNKDAIAS